jgi:hypothetical protein
LIQLTPNAHGALRRDAFMAWPLLLGSRFRRKSRASPCGLRGLTAQCGQARVARELHLSEGTVKMHLHHIYGKLRVGGRTQLALCMAGARAGMRESGNKARRDGELTTLDRAAAARLKRKNSVQL